MSEKEPRNFNDDLLKNLEEDLEKFGSESKKTIQDFVPYNESIIWDLSDQYYNSKGIMAWSNNAPKIIPHKIGTNYQSALAFAKLVKTNLEEFPSSEKITVLEIGAGSGRFSMHFLLAAKELGILEKVELVISDYSQFNLDSIKSAKILDAFIEGEDYQFRLIDITKKEDFFSNQSLSGKSYMRGLRNDEERSLLVVNERSRNERNEADEVLRTGSKPRAVFMHYVLDALPLTIIRKNEKIEELFISSSIRKEQELDVLSNDFLQSRIEHEDDWREYKPESVLEKKYWDFFSDYHSKSYNQELYYSYTALEAMSNLLYSLDENGFLLNIDILPGNERRYIVVGNSIAHEVDNCLLESFVKTNAGEALVNDDRSISRLLVTKSKKILDEMIPKFREVFEKENLVRDYIELEKEIEKELEIDFVEGLERKLKRLTELAPYYAFTYELWARYYKELGDDDKFQEALKKAEALDFWKDL